MRQTERADIGRPHLPGFTSAVRMHPLLSGMIDRMENWDVPDGDMAQALAVKVPPSTAPFLILQYRAPMRSEYHFGSAGHQHRRYRHAATMVWSGAVIVRPTGPLGLLIVRLKPEAAACLLGERIMDFVDEKIDLSNIFKASELSLLEEMLLEATDSRDRFARVESFLLQTLDQRQPRPLASRAAQRLRGNPSLSVGRLAAQLDVSERQLSRGFRAVFGTSPKQFARVARMERVLAMRHGGSPWADIAHACGFADQAHMINDFGAIIGASPQQFFSARTGGADLENDAGQSAAPVVWLP